MDQCFHNNLQSKQTKTANLAVQKRPERTIKKRTRQSCSAGIYCLGDGILQCWRCFWLFVGESQRLGLLVREDFEKRYMYYLMSFYIWWTILYISVYIDMNMSDWQLWHLTWIAIFWGKGLYCPLGVWHKDTPNDADLSHGISGKKHLEAWKPKFETCLIQNSFVKRKCLRLCSIPCVACDTFPEQAQFMQVGEFSWFALIVLSTVLQVFRYEEDGWEPCRVWCRSADPSVCSNPLSSSRLWFCWCTQNPASPWDG